MRERGGTKIRDNRTRWSEERAILIKGMTKKLTTAVVLLQIRQIYKEMNNSPSNMPIYIYHLNLEYLQRDRVVYNCYANNMHTE